MVNGELIVMVVLFGLFMVVTVYSLIYFMVLDMVMDMATLEMIGMTIIETIEIKNHTMVVQINTEQNMEVTPILHGVKNHKHLKVE